MKNSEKKKKQDELIERTSENVDGYFRDKSDAINKYVASGHRNVFLIMLVLVTFVPMLTGLFMYHQNFFELKPSKVEQHHQTIMAPHLQQEMKLDLLIEIQKKVKEKEAEKLKEHRQ